MSTEEALVTLGETTADAALGVLASLCPEGVEKGNVGVVQPGASPLQSLAYPAIATDVAYTDGVSGGNVFTMTRLGVRRLAAAMMGAELPSEDSDTELDEMETSALGEAMNQMMAAGAAALTKALGYPVDISVPTTRVLQSESDAEGAYPQSPHATRVSFTVLGESCRLIQLVPNAFVVRMGRALDNEITEQDDRGGEHNADPGLSSKLRRTHVRVAAELGRAQVRLKRLAAPLPGEVIELNRTAHDPIDLCVNGQRFATGELLLIDPNDWAVRIDHVLDVNPADYLTPIGGT
ncbi:MAG TPA: FliM/FliN family flagellar motor switch protein [Solirubrobacteraceae bacterium]|nr:FliM/FliN family flagellar motor switch protein [Solirubrobacteraceae bacterium]